MQGNTPQMESETPTPNTAVARSHLISPFPSPRHDAFMHFIFISRGSPDRCKRAKKRVSVSTSTGTGPPSASPIGCRRIEDTQIFALLSSCFGLVLGGEPPHQMLTAQQGARFARQRGESFAVLDEAGSLLLTFFSSLFRNQYNSPTYDQQSYRWFSR